MKAEGICWNAPTKPVLKDVSVEVGQNDFLALIGPNGAGKTTLLRIIDLLERPHSGRILFKKQNTDGPEEFRRSVRRRISLVFQQATLFDFSVEQNVTYPLQIRGIKGNAARRQAKTALELVRLDKLKNQNALSLSGGEAQRAAIARAIVTEPELLLLDEPTANIDPPNSRIVEEALIALHKEKNTPVILATHNLFQARRLSEHTAFLLDGQLHEYGETAQVFKEPKSQAVKAFLSGEIGF